MKSDSPDAAGLTALIITCFEKHGLDDRTKQVGQGYDGAAVISDALVCIYKDSGSSQIYILLLLIV